MKSLRVSLSYMFVCGLVSPVIVAGGWVLQELYSGTGLTPIQLQYLYVGISCFSVFSVFGFFLGRYRYRAYIAETTDTMTGLLSRQAVISEIDGCLELNDQQGRIFSLVFFRIDNLGRLNRESGYAAGDKALRTMAGLVKKHAGKVAHVGRFSDNSFMLLFPEKTRAEAERVVAKIKKGVLKSGKKTALYKGLFSVSTGFFCADQAVHISSVEVVKMAERAAADDRLLSEAALPGPVEKE